MTNIKIFENEEFGKVRTVEEDGKVLFCASDVAKALGYARPNDAVAAHCRATAKRSTLISGKMQEINFIPEGDVYRLITRSKLPSAEKFESWVFDEVLPAIRKTGGYVNNTETFVDAYFAGIPEEMKAIIRVSLDTIKIKDKIIEEQKQTIADKDKEIEHKEDVICGLVDDIDLATKRQRITQIIRFHSKTGEAIADKWNLLYSEFEKKYHVNLSVRFNNHKDTYKPKLKNKVDLIDRHMEMIPQLYEVCCKLFENDVKMLREEWESAIAC